MGSRGDRKSFFLKACIFLTAFTCGASWLASVAGAATVIQPTCAAPSHSSGGDFGCRNAPVAGASTQHKGTDYPCGNGSPLSAGISGSLHCTANNGKAGNSCAIRGTGVNSCITVKYFHMSGSDFPAGFRTVNAGDSIGRSGNTGIGTGAHLHFELWINGTPVNSTTFFQKYNSGNICGDAGGVKELYDDAQAAMNDCGGNKPGQTDPGGIETNECDIIYEAAITEQVRGYQQYLSQTTRAVVPPPPSVAQLSCFDYYSKLMSNSVLSRFTVSGMPSIGSIGFGGGPIADVLSTPFQSFMQGNIAPLLDPNKMLSSITANIGSTLSSAFNVSSALGLGSGANPALCSAMTAMWKLVQCSGTLTNLPSFNLDLGSLGQSLMPKGCASKVLFDGAMKAAGLSMNEPISYYGALQYFTAMEKGYR